MDYSKLREKVELIIKGLEYQKNIEVEEEFLELLDKFILHQLRRLKAELAKQKTQEN